MAIKTSSELSTYILGMLGEPIITVEVSPTQITNCIDLAIQKFSNFAMGGEDPKIYTFPLVQGVNSYTLDDRVQAITRVRTISSSISFQMPGVIMVTPSDICAMSINPMGGIDIGNISVMMAEMSTLEKLFDVEPNWVFNDNTKILQFLDSTPLQVNNNVIIEAYVSYAPAEIDNIYNHQWIKAYSMALVKQCWGGIIGKLNTTLINGATLNYDRILTEANAELERLDAELLTRWTRPLGIYRG